MSDHHHAHGPANRGRVVHTTSAPLFVTGDDAAPGVVVVVHAEPGIDSTLELSARTTAAAGHLVVVPYLYFRDGGPDYPRPDAAGAAFAGLSDSDVDADVDGALDHVTGRLHRSLNAVRLVGVGAGIDAARRAAARHGLPEPLAAEPAHPWPAPPTPARS